MTHLPAGSPIFSGMFARYAMSLNVGYGGQTDRVSGELVSGTYFPVLGVGAAVGRVITPEDDRVRAGHAVAVLSYEYWRTRFGADPGVIGKTIVVNNRHYYGNGEPDWQTHRFRRRSGHADAH